MNIQCKHRLRNITLKEEKNQEKKVTVVSNLPELDSSLAIGYAPKVCHYPGLAGGAAAWERWEMKEDISSCWKEDLGIPLNHPLIPGSYVKSSLFLPLYTVPHKPKATCPSDCAL